VIFKTFVIFTAACAGAIPLPGQTDPNAAPADPAMGVARAVAVNEREVVTRLQIFLDQKCFGPGKIDGRWGEFTGKALGVYARANGLPVDATIYDRLQLGDLYPIYTTYTIQDADAGWIGPTAGKPEQQAKLKKLLYGDLLEFLEERYHSDQEFLRKLNPDRNMDALKAGDTVRVPNVEPFKIEEVSTVAALPENAAFSTRTVRINRRQHMLTVLDGESVIAAFPITPGSDETPTPPGNWKVVGIAVWPNFRWDEGVLNHGVRTDKFFMLPPGPNNPVGVAWTALSKPGIGIHGTNTPGTIGRAASHGCMRLANWDSIRFAQMVTRGTKVTIE
jgi:lipoprotein-anchoring transpeptidase ErfK/SrfK